MEEAKHPRSRCSSSTPYVPLLPSVAQITETVENMIRVHEQAQRADPRVVVYKLSLDHRMPKEEQTKLFDDNFSAGCIVHTMGTSLISKYTKSNECRTCKKASTEGLKLKVCVKCGIARYCSVDCQKKDWADHKSECLFIRDLKISKMAQSYRDTEKMIAEVISHGVIPYRPMVISVLSNKLTKKTLYDTSRFVFGHDFKALENPKDELEVLVNFVGILFKRVCTRLVFLVTSEGVIILRPDTCGRCNHDPCYLQNNIQMSESEKRIKVKKGILKERIERYHCYDLDTDVSSQEISDDALRTEVDKTVVELQRVYEILLESTTRCCDNFVKSVTDGTSVECKRCELNSFCSEECAKKRRKSHKKVCSKFNSDLVSKWSGFFKASAPKIMLSKERRHDVLITVIITSLNKSVVSNLLDHFPCHPSPMIPVAGKVMKLFNFVNTCFGPANTVQAFIIVAESREICVATSPFCIHKAE